MQVQWGQVSSWTTHAKTRATGFPRWGIPLVAVCALPGLLLALLSLALLGASVLALLLLTVPAYKLVGWVSGSSKPAPRDVYVEDAGPSPGSKTVEVKVLQ